MFKFNLLEDEQPIAVYRQTEAVLIKNVFWVFVLIYLPWFFLIKYELVGSYMRLLLFWTVLVFIYAVNSFVLWLINCYVVTNKRLVILKYQNLLNKHVLESPIDRILNVSFVSKGLLQMLFGYGDVKVQVAGLSEPLVLKNIPKPSEIKDFLWHAHMKYSKIFPGASLK